MSQGKSTTKEMGERESRMHYMWSIEIVSTITLYRKPIETILQRTKVIDTYLIMSIEARESLKLTLPKGDV